jgi:hypothetical protein
MRDRRVEGAAELVKRIDPASKPEIVLPVTVPPLESTKVMPLLPLACGATQPVTVLLVMDTVLASPSKTMMPLALPAGPLLPMSVIVL